MRDERWALQGGDYLCILATVLMLRGMFAHVNGRLTAVFRGTQMKLETAGDISSDNVSEAELARAFQDDAGRGEFIILSQADQIYIQASGEYDEPYILEYRDGDSDHHFQSVEDVPKEMVQAVFMKYLKGDHSWKRDVAWAKLEHKPWWKFW